METTRVDGVNVIKAQRRAPAHATLCLVVAVVARGVVEDRRRARGRPDVAALLWQNLESAEPETSTAMKTAAAPNGVARARL